MVIGIMGGVGSGKSTVLDYLQEKYNAYIIKSDNVAKEIMKKGNEVCRKVLEIFPQTDCDGEIDSVKLADIVFSDKEKLKILNSITHPAVIKEIIRQITEHSNGMVVVESALMLDSGIENFCDELWFVYCEKEERIRRLKISRGYTIQKATDIIDNQPADDVYHQYADEFIDNSYAKENTIEQIDFILSQAEC